MKTSPSSLCALGFQPLRKIPQMYYSILEVNHVWIWKTKIDALIAQVDCIFRYQLDDLFTGIFCGKVCWVIFNNALSYQINDIWAAETRMQLDIFAWLI